MYSCKITSFVSRLRNKRGYRYLCLDVYHCPCSVCLLLLQFPGATDCYGQSHVGIVLSSFVPHSVVMSFRIFFKTVFRGMGLFVGYKSMQNDFHLHGWERSFLEKEREEYVQILNVRHCYLAVMWWGYECEVLLLSSNMIRGKQLQNVNGLMCTQREQWVWSREVKNRLTDMKVPEVAHIMFCVVKQALYLLLLTWCAQDVTAPRLVEVCIFYWKSQISFKKFVWNANIVWVEQIFRILARNKEPFSPSWS